MSPSRFLPLFVSTTLAVTSLQAQQDAPPIDMGQLLQALKAIREQQVAGTKALKMSALREVQAAAASPAAAVNAWEEAVRMVQFEGAAKEGAAFKEWREKEGDALKEKEAASAAQLHLRWMALTLQRAAGVPVKDLLPNVIAFTKDVAADQLAIDALEDSIKRDKEIAASGKHGRERKRNDEMVKRMHDQIIRASVGGSVVAQAMKITELVKGETWEMSAGNVDGIFRSIVLPELRAAKDPRLLEYWDMKLKKESENAAKAKLAFEAEKFNQVRRPEILWNRAQDVLALGQRNRAIGEMFTLIKTFPTHPSAGGWIKTLEDVLMPPAVPAGDPAPPLAPPPDLPGAN